MWKLNVWGRYFWGRVGGDVPWALEAELQIMFGFDALLIVLFCSCRLGDTQSLAVIYFHY
jgi:hypothetical protein